MPGAVTVLNWQPLRRIWRYTHESRMFPPFAPLPLPVSLRPSSQRHSFPGLFAGHYLPTLSISRADILTVVLHTGAALCANSHVPLQSYDNVHGKLVTKSCNFAAGIDLQKCSVLLQLQRGMADGGKLVRSWTG